MQIPESVDKALVQLYEWYDAHHRQLPFRVSPDEYRLWVAEVMLHQTRVAAMLPRYETFLRRFPDISTLAAGALDDVLTEWQGLGYYSRARNLHAGAKHVMKEFGGRFPTDRDSVMKIPGIGPYTAAAILSVCHGAALAVLDGNVKRVLTRLLLPEKSSDRELQRLADELICRRGNTHAGTHNQAMMELGATICNPLRPDCDKCPLGNICRAKEKGGPEFARTLPEKKQRRTFDVDLFVHLVTAGRSAAEQALIVRHKDGRFLRGLWFFPYVARSPEWQFQTPGLGDLLAKEPADSECMDRQFRHSITTHRIAGSVRLHRLTESRKADRYFKAVESRWVPLSEVENAVVSSIARKALTIYRSA